ncbi:MAG TPA: phosphatase PAP2 family protein [Gemmatimonadaceae bacterium]
MRPASATSRSHSTIALLVAFAALVAFLLIVRVVTRSSVDAFDIRAEQWFAAHQSPALYKFFDFVSKVAGITSMRVVGFASAVLLFLFRSRRLGIAMLATALAGMQTFEIAKHFIARQRPAHGYAIDPTYAFPSGHATLAAAVCGTLAYVLWRERLLRGAAAIGVGIALPVVVGASRLYLDMHWATDVAAGWLAGLIIACMAAAAYEWTLTSTAHSR